jgi:hypothetical protein
LFDESTDLSGKTVALRIKAGLGDALMAVGGSATVLKKKGCLVTAAVPSHHQPMVNNLMGVDYTILHESLDIPSVAARYDHVVDFEGAFFDTEKLRAGSYYKLVGDRLGFDVSPGKFVFESISRDEKVVAMHPGSSNANRRWDPQKWEELASQFENAGWDVLWLGVAEEFGFSRGRIRKLSDSSLDLVWQSEMLAKCDYFVGNDSGFCHIAGILGVRGCVLFSVTSAEDVIGCYPLLAGVDKYDGELVPTRSMHQDDAMGLRCMAAITVNDVIDRIGLQTGIFPVLPLQT